MTENARETGSATSRDDWLRLPIHALLDLQAQRTPSAPALFSDSRTITFAELQRRSQSVAAALQARGIGPGSLVGLHLHRSIEWVAAMIGVLRTGAAVVPLPPSDPARRLETITGLARLAVVVTDRSTPVPPSLGAESAVLEDLESAPPAATETTAVDPAARAFVLSSSGSTGVPKLIVRSHRSFYHRLAWTWSCHPLGPDEIGCQKAHSTTTHAVYELLEPLLQGTPVVIVPDEEVRDLERFWTVVRSRAVTRLLLVPSALRASFDVPSFDPARLRVLVLMGEAVEPDLVERALARLEDHTRLYSIYGSTEASSALVTDLREATPGSAVPLGSPIRKEVRARVLDESLETVPAGAEGRLYLGGPMLFDEYLGDPELTASVLIDVPGEPDPLYDTRDRVRTTLEGSIEFVGRVDHVVKVRGFRVDTGEVERLIQAHPDVREAAIVLHRSENADASLIGFYAPAAADAGSIFRMLRDRLPAYMVPSRLIGLNGIPRTPSGKLDRVQLLAGHGVGDRDPAAAGGTGTVQSRVVDSWQRVLQHAGFDEQTSFFEAGGTSLSVYALVVDLRQRFGMTAEQLSAETVYRHPTVAALTRYIERVQGGAEGGGDADASLSVTLRQARGGAAAAPLFVVSSAGGALGAYEKLARRIGTDREIVGLRDPFIWGARDPRGGFDAWVSAWVDEIRTRQAHGPYFICAYSSAGAFGYEIARRLRAAGEAVSVLALIDPIALDRSDRKRFGHWALAAVWMRSPVRTLVRAAGRLRMLMGGRKSHPSGGSVGYSPTDEDLQQLSTGSLQDREHLLRLSALMELNTGLPFALDPEDFSGIAPGSYFDVFQARVASVSPGLDAETMARTVIQYEMQVRAQHAYRLAPYDGFVLLVEPASHHAGLLATLLRPFVRNLHARVLEVDPATGRTAELSRRFGALDTHYRCMRDDGFVARLARELEPHV